MYISYLDSLISFHISLWKWGREMTVEAKKKAPLNRGPGGKHLSVFLEQFPNPLECLNLYSSDSGDHQVSSFLPRECWYYLSSCPTGAARMVLFSQFSYEGKHYLKSTVSSTYDGVCWANLQIWAGQREVRKKLLSDKEH